VKNGIEAMVLGDATPQDAMAQVDGRFQDALDEYATDVGA
jgi:hypothetical protein